MRKYDPGIPLISLHIPKMAGTSYREVLSTVFGSGLLLHYNRQIILNGSLLIQRPGIYEWGRLLQAGKHSKVCIHGHFRNSENTGTDDYYPEARQFISLLRDPLDSVVSYYFYQKMMVKSGLPMTFPYKNVNEYVERNNSQLWNHLPRAMQSDPHRFIDDNFVLIGCLENLEYYAKRFRELFSFDFILPVKNTSPRDETLDTSVAKRWANNNGLAIELYLSIRHNRKCSVTVPSPNAGDDTALGPFSSIVDDFQIFGDVLLSKAGIAYLVGGNHSVLKYASGELLPSKQSIANFHDNIHCRHKLSHKNNAKYAHVIFPDKQSVLDDCFPVRPLYRLGEAYLSSDSSLTNVIYPVAALKSIADRSYHPYDTHLSDVGSLEVLRILLSVLGVDAPQCIDKLSRRITKAVRWPGDLGAKFTPQLIQEGIFLDCDWPLIQLCSTTSFNDGMIDLVFSPTAPIKSTILLFGDSFFRVMLKHFSAVFSKVVCLRTRFFHPEMVCSINPAYIVSGCAERYLSNVQSDKESSLFSLYPHFKGNINNYERDFLEAWQAVTSPGSTFSRDYFSKINVK